MAVYTSLTPEEIAAWLAQHYALGRLVAAAGIAAGVENTNYRLVTQGENGAETRTILTIYEKRMNPAELPFFLALMQHLARQGIACPQPIARKDGGLLGMLAGKPAALVSFLEGASRDRWTAAHVEQVGAALGALHRASEDFTGTRPNALSFEGWSTLSTALRGKLDTIAPGLERLVDEELAHWAAHGPMLAALPRGVIHADLFPDNVFFDGDRLSGVIDFYFACTDALAYDVAVTLNAWCFAPDGTLDTAKVEALLAGYQRVRPLSAAELTALPILLRGAALRFLLTRSYDWLHHPPDALVTPHDPLDYAVKLRVHRQSGWVVSGG